MLFDSFVFTTAGGRDENQDSAGILEKDGAGIYVVADGLGGHQHGRLASDTVVSSLIGGWSHENEPSPERLFKGVEKANSDVVALQQEMNSNMKSTVVALTVKENKASWANTGDSRLYYIHNGSIEKITEDHSVSYKKYLAGEITRAQIGSDPDQSCLLKALGNESRWEPDLNSVDKLEAGDAFLLCCDGMWEHILDEEILVDYLKSESAEEWAALMLMRAMARIQPGNDNLTLITLMLK